MRIPAKSSDEYIKSLNVKADQVCDIFMENIKKITKTSLVKVMLGNSTVTEQQTFDPQLVRNFYQKIINKLPDWKNDGILTSNNDDLRRLFVKFEAREENYFLSWHISLQYHVVLYYKLENRVIKYQKELSEIIDKTKSKEEKFTGVGDKLILEKLKEMGYKDVNPEQLFEIFFRNDQLRDKLYADIQSEADIDFKKLSQRKLDLFKELDDLLLETYQAAPVLIDDVRLIAGEEGVVCSFDILLYRKQIKEGVIDPKKIPERIKEKLLQKFDAILQVIKF
ncbi:MAG: hypothetical protein NPMRIOTA_50016 [Nitrosopumilales archaeon]|nr:MAG: hypothetical protein NPMRIOTA_50016 [Nitrosopumilales archaeon]